MMRGQGVVLSQCGGDAVYGVREADEEEGGSFAEAGVERVVGEGLIVAVFF